MIERPQFVVDASVAVKWLLNLRDEPFLLKAGALLADHRHNLVHLIAPDIFRHELASAVVGAMQHQPPRITVQQAVGLIREIPNLGITLIQQDDLMPAAALFARRWGCSYYDSLYLALAQRLNCPWLYAESKLRRNLSHRFPLALWIEDYQPVGLA